MTRLPWKLIAGSALAAVALGPVSLVAQLPVTRLDGLFPAGGQAGTSVDVTLQGTDLDGVHDLLFQRPGLTAAKLDGGKLRVTIDPTTPPGLCEVRALGRYGVSNAGLFVVGDLPEGVDAGTNHSRETAQPIPVNSTVNGVSDAEAIDYYHFPARKGERFFITAAAQRLDSPMDATLVVYNPAGSEIAGNRDTDGRDPFVDLTAGDDGDYQVAVYDFTYGGGPAHRYRLTLTTAPKVDFIIPAAIEAGRTTRCTVYGRHLPDGTPTPGQSIGGRPLEQIAVDIAAPAQPEPTTELSPSSVTAPGFSWSLVTAAGRSNAVRIGLATAPPVTEIEPNHTAATAQRIPVPCEISGHFDGDWFALEAGSMTPGKPLRVEVFSERLGHPTDPVLGIYKATKSAEGTEKMERVLEADDQAEVAGAPRMQTATRDPVARFVPEAGAAYRIFVQDRFATRSPAVVYRLAIRDEQPDFQLLAAPEDPAPSEKGWSRWSLLLRKGGTGLLRVVAVRRDDFSGPIALSVEGLPDGVTGSGGFIPAGQTSGWVVLYASPAATPWAGRIRLIGRAAGLEREAQSVTWRWNVPDLGAGRLDARLSTGLVVAVTDGEPAPVVLTPAENKTYATSLGGVLEIPVHLTSNTPFKGGLQLSPFGLPGLAKPKTAEVKVDGKGEGSLSLDLAKRDGNSFTPGLYTVYASARGTVLYKSDDKAAARELRDVQFSAPVQVQIDPAPLGLTPDPAGGMCLGTGARTELTVKIDRRYGFAEAVELNLTPPAEVKGFASAKLEVAKEATSGKLTLEANADAKPGTYQFTLEARCKWNGEDLSLKTELPVTVAP